MTAPVPKRRGRTSKIGYTSRVLHALPGRVRLHLPGWSRAEPAELEQVIRAVPGVRQATASSTTRNILILFDPNLVSPEAVQAALRSYSSGSERPTTTPADRAAVMRERIEGQRQRARIAVPDLDRDPR